MKRTLKGQTTAILTAAILGTGMLAGVMSVPASAQLDAATSELKTSTAESKASQKRINQLDDQIERTVAEYRREIDLLEDLREYNALQRKIVADQERRIRSLDEQIKNVSNIDREIIPLIQRMIEALEVFVNEDVPFLLNERLGRVETLNSIMPRADVSAAEKYRKTLEAYQIENDYGRTIEAYTANLDDGRQVNYLKVGRVGFYYQTLNQSETMMWNQETKEWASANGYAEEITTAIKMAKDQIPPDLLVVPLPGANELN